MCSTHYIYSSLSICYKRELLQDDVFLENPENDALLVMITL